MFIPLSWSSKFVSFLTPRGEDESHTDGDGAKKPGKIETKTEGYGFQVSIQVLKDVHDPIQDEVLLKELA